MISRVVSFTVVFLMATSTSGLLSYNKSTNTTDVLSRTYLRKLDNRYEQKVQWKRQQQLKEVFDISDYGIKFDKCQYIEIFPNDSDLAVSTGKVVTRENTISSIEQFVIFRFCRSGLDSCPNDYEKRILDLNEYLHITVRYRKDEQDNICKLCDEHCEVGDANRYLGVTSSHKNDVDCDSCIDECKLINTMKDHGYIDAINFITCLKIGDDKKEPIYAGPMCGGDQGSKIKISVFQDERCLLLDESKSVEDYITDEEGHAFKLSYNLLKRTHNNNQPIKCTTFDEKDTIGTKEVCTSLYDASTRYEHSQLN